jgi:hypothetical protein
MPIEHLSPDAGSEQAAKALARDGLGELERAQEKVRQG